MRSIILFGLAVTLTAVSSKEHHHPHRPDHGPPRRYKDSKNKRGIGDYPLGLSFGGGPSFPSFQGPSAGISPFGSSGFPGIGGYGGYGGGSPLGLASQSIPFGLSGQQSLGFSNLGASTLGSPSFGAPAVSAGLGGLGSLGSLGNLGGLGGLGQSLSLSPSSGYSLSSSGLNLGSLLGGQETAQVGLFSPEKTGPITFGSQQTPRISYSQQQYTPTYATQGSQATSSNYNVPVVLGASQGSNLQGYSLSASPMNSQGISISSLSAGNGVTYSMPSASLATRDTSSHPVSGGYLIAAQQSAPTASYSIPIASLTSLPGSSSSSSSSAPSRYTISMPTQSSSSGPTAAASYQLSVSAPSSSSSGTVFTKYTPASSEGSSYATDHIRSYGSTLKLGPMIQSSPSSMSSTYSMSSGANYNTPASVPSMTSSMSSSSGASGSPVTSYGTPVMAYTIPSTSYGTPTSSQSMSSSGFSQSSPSMSFASAASYTNPMQNFGSSSSSSSFPMSTSYKNADSSSYGTSSSSFSGPSSSYGSQSDSSSYGSQSDSSSYKNPSYSSVASLSNSIDYPSHSSSSYDDGTDSSNSFSNLSPRYLKYPFNKPVLPYVDSTDTAVSSSYDTISYSVPSGKY